MANWKRITLRMAAVTIFSLIVLAGNPACAQEAPSKTGAFLAYCATNQKGCADRVAEINFAMLVTAPMETGDRKWCPTKETNDVNTVTRQVVAWLTAHPEVADTKTGDGIQMALYQLYPCKP
jgi:hypothetical protein